MKRIIILVIAIGMVVIWVMAQAVESPNGVALWEQITIENPYSHWSQFPDHTGMQKGQAPHGPLHIVYVNLVGLKKGWPKPDGTVIVKENYTADKTLAAVTVMYKVKGYNPEAGDWYWVKYAPDGLVQKEGKPDGCINCHSVQAEHDFIMVSSH